MRVKPIPPVMREKRRYMLIRNAGWSEIVGAMRAEFGRVYAGISGMRKIEEGRDYLILRVQRDFDWMVRAAIALHDFGKAVWVERTSGSIKRLKMKGNIRR